jgi:hypothetical protein
MLRVSAPAAGKWSSRRGVVREQLVAWSGDCLVRGTVELGDGRLSDQVNELDTVTFFDVTLHAFEDGHEVTVDELEVDRGELHVIEVRGRRGDPDRRLRTVEERVTLELGPFLVTGNLHRPPNTQPMAALSRWARFVPVTDAVVGLRDRDGDHVLQEVVLVNRGRITKARPHAAIPIYTDEPVPPAGGIA